MVNTTRIVDTRSPAYFWVYLRHKDQIAFFSKLLPGGGDLAELKIFLKTFCGLSWAQLGQCEWVVRWEGEKYLYFYKQPPV